MTEQRKQLLRKFICLLGLSSLSSFAAPQTLRVDGSIFNAAGAPLTGNRDVQVKAYDASSGGSVVWTSSVYTAAVSNGRFSIALDATADSTSLTSRLAAKAANGEIWFEIIYDTGTADGSMDSPVTVSSRIRGKGSMFALVAAKADALNGVTTTVAEMNRLAGITSNVQPQIDSAFSAISGKIGAADIAGKADTSAVVAKSGDTMSGPLNMANQMELRMSEGSGGGTNYIGLKAPSTLAADLSWTLPNADGGNNQVMKFNATTKTFFWDNDAAGGVTGTGSSTDNALVRWDGAAGTGVQSSNIIVSDGDTVNGIVGLTAANVNITSLSSGQVLIADAAKNIVGASNIDATELDYLNGVTTNIGSKVNLFTNTQASYLGGVTTSLISQLGGLTANIQSQINGIPSGTTRVAKTGDSMSGGLEVGSTITTTGLIKAGTGFDTTAINGTVKIGGTVVMSVGSSSNSANYFIGHSGAPGASGYYNLGFGTNAGKAITTGDKNIAVGLNAGSAILNGTQNVAIGPNAGAAINSGGYNVVVGADTASALTSGGSNTIVGMGAAYTITTQSNIVALGAMSGNANYANNGTFVGYRAGQLNSSGIDNTFVGDRAGDTLTTGGRNVFVGSASDSLAGVSMNVAVGWNANVNANSAVQIGPGTNTTDNSLQFWGYNFLDKNGNATFNSINSSVSSTELGYLDGVTANIQTQINSLGGGSYVAKGGDTMTGKLFVSGQNIGTSGAYEISGRTVLNVGASERTLVGISAGISSSGSAQSTYPYSRIGVWRK